MRVVSVRRMRRERGRERVQTSGKVSPECEFVESRKRGEVIGYVQQARDDRWSPAPEHAMRVTAVECSKRMLYHRQVAYVRRFFISHQ